MTMFEGDAVAILRESAQNVSDYNNAGEALRRLTDTTNVYYALDALADMVERDYVRREKCEAWKKLVKQWEGMYDEVLAERNELKRAAVREQHDELERQLDTMRDVTREFRDERDELQAKLEAAEYELKALRGDNESLGSTLTDRCGSLLDATKRLEIAELERDECADAADEAERKVKQLEHELRQARKYGEIWPRFEDGSFVELGDTVWSVSDAVVGVIEFDESGVELWTAGGHEFITRGLHGKRFKCPSLKAHDGEPIAIGETLYGLSDGKAWEVERIDHAGSHPVIGVNRNAAASEVLTRALKPEWLTHDSPRTLEDIIGEFGYLVAESASYPTMGDVRKYAAVIREKLAKEGE